MYKQKPWTLDDPCTGFKQLKLTVKESLREKVLGYLRDTEHDLSVEKASKLFGYSEASCRRILKDLREEGLIKIVNVEKRNVNWVGIYKSKLSEDAELPVQHGGKYFKSISMFLLEKRCSNPDTFDLFRRSLEKYDVKPKIVFAGNCRFTEAYPVTTLEKIWGDRKALKNEGFKKEEIGKKVTYLQSKKSTSARTSILNFLDVHRYSFLSKDIIKRSLLDRFNSSVFDGMVATKDILKITRGEGSEQVEFYQLNNSPIWNEGNWNSEIYLSNFISVSYFYEWNITKNKISKDKMKKKLAKLDLVTFEYIAENKKYVTLYSVEDLLRIFKKYLRNKRGTWKEEKGETKIKVAKEPTIKETTVTKEPITSSAPEPTKYLFKFKFFGKEISLSVGKC